MSVVGVFAATTTANPRNHQFFIDREKGHMPTIQLADLEIYYESLGVGEPLLFLHSGYSRGILAFACQMLDFQQNYTCYFPDFRGHGRTKCASLEWSMPRLAEDMINFLDALHIPRAHLFGYSLGGSVALYMAVQAPERVATLTTIGCSGFVDPRGADDFEAEQLLKNEQYAIIAHMTANHVEAHRGNWQEFMRQSAQDWRLYPQLTIEQLRGIRCPAYFIGGETDSFATEKQLQTLSELVEGSRYWVVPGCSHRPHMLREKPGEVNDEVLRFIKEHSMR
jgi:pimeloyl-ACP methyl ester carboxylesterase